MRSILFVAPFLVHLAISESVTITDIAAFPSQRPCAQECFGGGIYADAGALAYGIDCEYIHPQNECVCRLDLQDKAEGYLRDCVNRGCDLNSLDTNSAVSIYDAYCTSAGYIRDAATTTSASSPRLSSTSSQPQQTLSTSQTSSSTTSSSIEDFSTFSTHSSPSETQGSSPTNSVSNGSDNENKNGGSNEDGNDGGGDGLGTADIVGIVVGVLGFIATVIGTYFTYKSIKKNKKPQVRGFYQ
ncbi:hypothetical protein F5Y08DRAFT_333983 [Xylaria arbuscula]|nr:hypothetical protein F5Y08DRAFT_333983 [Xylaria arbuscula]